MIINLTAVALQVLTMLEAAGGEQDGAWEQGELAETLWAEMGLEPDAHITQVYTTNPLSSNHCCRAHASLHSLLQALLQALLNLGYHIMLTSPRRPHITCYCGGTGSVKNHVVLFQVYDSPACLHPPGFGFNGACSLVALAGRVAAGHGAAHAAAC